MSTVKFWDIPGGIHPPERKDLSNRTPIQRLPLPRRLILPLAQHIGAPAEPCVAVGERVRKGQPIAAANGAISVALHAPSSGTVSFIGPQPYPHASGIPVPAIVIDCDGLDEWTELDPCPDYRLLEPADLLARIAAAGISGLGGAGFPSAAKLRAEGRIGTLIINGTECEPYITADDLLMRERAAELVSGIEILAHLLQPDTVLIGIEDNKPGAAAAVRAAVGERPFGVRVFPTKYPSGGEKQLIQILTGQEVPSGGLPLDIGVLCQNVGTCVAIHDAVIHGRPLISRITTLTGEALARPTNVEALIGTPIDELLAFAGLSTGKLDRLIMGGPMMGFTLPSRDVPLIKTTNCLLAATRNELPPTPPAMPCIRCGDCAEACPASLLPQQLHFFALGEDVDQLRAHNLFDCIECGACAYVCPSSIPLVQYYRASKAQIRDQEQKQRKAEHARIRFEQRQDRLRRAEEQKEADRKARAEKAARAKAAQAEASAATPATEAVAQVKAQKTGGLSDEQKKLKIEASMAQVALKKAEKQLAAHATPELESQVAELRRAAEAAQQALDAALAAAPPAPPAAPAVDEAELKKAKIEAAMLRAQVRKLEKVESPSDEQQAELTQLRDKLAAADRLLAEQQGQASAAPAKPANDDALKKAKIEAAMLRAQIRKLEKVEVPSDEQQAELAQLRGKLAAADKALAEQEGQAPAAPAKPAGDDALKKAKVELAMKRAELKKAEKAGTDGTELGALREALAAAEQALHAAEDASGKPVPARVLVEKRPVDEATRTLKTEVAFARADLRKLERNDSAEATALEAARARLAEAERQLEAHQAATAE